MIFQEDVCDLSQLAPAHTLLFSLHLVFLSAGLIVVTLGCINFPLQERVSCVHRLQIMTGKTLLQPQDTDYTA